MNCYKPKEVGDKFKISVRTLHYYDQIGLLKPEIINSNGHRFYTDNDLIKLNQILFLKELGFSLDEIKEIQLNQGLEKVIDKQKIHLIDKKKRIENVIDFLEICNLDRNDQIIEVFDTLKNKSLQIPFGAFACADSRFAAAEIPFLFHNIYACNAAQKQLFPLYSDMLEKKFRLKALTFWNIPPMELASVHHPVTSLEQWQGRVVLAFSQPIGAVIKELGGVPVFVSWKDEYWAMLNGLADTVIQSTAITVEYRFHDIIHYLTRCNFIMSWVLFALNLDLWNSLPKNTQEVLLEMGRVLGRVKNEDYIGKTEENLKQLTEQGIKISSLDLEERTRWAEALRPYREHLINSMGDFGDTLTRVVEEANLQFPEVM